MAEMCVRPDEKLELSPGAEQEVKRLKETIDECNESIKNKQEAIDSINKDIVDALEIIVINQARVIGLKNAKNDRREEIHNQYDLRDWAYQEINSIRNRERAKTESKKQ